MLDHSRAGRAKQTLECWRAVREPLLVAHQERYAMAVKHQGGGVFNSGKPATIDDCCTTNQVER
jgi:hypothetical protein